MYTNDSIWNRSCYEKVSFNHLRRWNQVVVNDDENLF